jgi:hypothetical protein
MWTLARMAGALYLSPSALRKLTKVGDKVGRLGSANINGKVYVHLGDVENWLLQSLDFLYCHVDPRLFDVPLATAFITKDEPVVGQQNLAIYKQMLRRSVAKALLASCGERVVGLQEEIQAECGLNLVRQRPRAAKGWFRNLLVKLRS